MAGASSPLPTGECVSRIRKYQSRLLDLKLCLAVGREEWSASARCRGQQIAVPACRIKWQVVFSFNMLFFCRVSILYRKFRTWLRCLLFFVRCFLLCCVFKRNFYLSDDCSLVESIASVYYSVFLGVL